MRAAVLLLAAAGLAQEPAARRSAVGAVAHKSAVSRAAVAAIEENLETRLLRADSADPFEILAYPQGVYLEGYGAVFTAKINLIVTPGLSPFRQQMQAQDIARVRERKLRRLPLLKSTMRGMLQSAAASLDPVARGEQIVLSVALFHAHWENTGGLPAQIVMQAPREKLLTPAVAEASIQVQEF